jgi:hypothetical protein
MIFIQVAGIQISELLRVGILIGWALIEAVDDGAQLFFGLVLQRRERADRAFVGRQLIIAQPFAVQVLVYVVLRTCRGIDVLKIQPTGQRRARSRRCRCGRRGRCGRRLITGASRKAGDADDGCQILQAALSLKLQ